METKNQNELWTEYLARRLQYNGYGISSVDTDGSRDDLSLHKQINITPDFWIALVRKISDSSLSDIRFYQDLPRVLEEKVKLGGIISGQERELDFEFDGEGKMKNDYDGNWHDKKYNEYSGTRNAYEVIDDIFGYITQAESEFSRRNVELS